MRFGYYLCPMRLTPSRMYFTRGFSMCGFVTRGLLDFGIADFGGVTGIAVSVAGAGDAVSSIILLLSLLVSTGLSHPRRTLRYP